MNESILKALYEQGPLDIQQIADELDCDYLNLCEPLADLTVGGNVHMEFDGTFWFARDDQSAAEAAA